MKCILYKSCAWFGLILLSSNGFASNGQVFDGINYINPANNAFVKKLRISIGTILDNPKIKFKGTINNNSRTAISNPVITSPYTRIIYRVNPKLALGLAVSEPFRAIIKFNVPFRVPGIFDAENIRSVKIEPNVALELVKNLWLGVGLNIIRYKAEINIVKIINQGQSLGVLHFDGKDVAVSYVIGLLYRLNNQYIFDLAFYSKSSANLTGNFSINSPPLPTTVPTLLTIPDTIIGAITHIINKQWLVRFKWAHSFWTDFNGTSFNNANISVPIPLNYHNTNDYTLLVRHKFKNSYALSLFAAKDFTPTNLARTNFALAGDIFSSGLIVSKRTSQNFTVRGMVGYALNIKSVKINQANLNTFGDIKNRIIFSNFQIVYRMD
jgi:long-chain fatty acid transport protein